ncbi:MAG TPA: HNH endonuclease signature motif containing protein [Kofleriaceae bacterium]
MLAPLVAESRTIAELLGKLGLAPTGGNYRHISRCLRIAGIDTSHFHWGRGRALVDRERLQALVRESKSVTEVLAKLGRPTSGRPHLDMTAQIRGGGFDLSHFRKGAWSRGLNAMTHPSIAKQAESSRYPDERVFVENCKVHIYGAPLARRLVRLGVEYCCVWCGISEWRGKPLRLHIDHINGINNDNRRENLRFLCPNCHSQTETYSNRRR